jgi:hypothetical protein
VPRSRHGERLVDLPLDKVSRTMGTTRAAKWKAMKKKLFSHQRWIACINIAFVRTTWLSGASPHPPALSSPSPLGHGWELASGYCCPVCHTCPALPTYLPELQLSEDSEEDESDDDDEEDNNYCVPRRCGDSSESSDMDSIDSTSDAEC